MTLPTQSESRTARELNRAHERSKVTLPRLEHAPRAPDEGIRVQTQGFNHARDASHPKRMTNTPQLRHGLQRRYQVTSMIADDLAVAHASLKTV